MQFLLLIFLASAQVLRSNAECIIMPIPPTAENGLAPCGWGSLTAGCECCHGQTACQSLLQVCTLGSGDNYICVNNPQYTSSCASEGFANCGTGCMPSTATCCSDQTGWCQAGYHCGTAQNCIPDDSGIPISSSPSKASVPAPTPSTAKTTATSPTTKMTVLTASTTKTTATSPMTTMTVLSPSASKGIATSLTDTVPFLSSPTKQNTASTSTSASLSPSSSSVATRKRCGGISILVTMVVMNVFGFCWL